MYELSIKTLIHLCCAAEVMIKNGNVSKRDLNKASKHGQELAMRVKGNRADSVRMNWSDMRLVAESIMRDCLEKLEKSHA